MDITQSNWNESDASNITAAPDGAPEGMAPSGVNDVLRAHQGAIKRWYNWSMPKLTAGTSTAYTLSYGVAPGALVDGMTHLVEFHTANGATSTLNVNLLGAVPLHYYSYGAWRPLPPGLFAANALLRVAYNAVAGAYRLLGLADRTGVIEDFAGATAPAGTLLCYGQTISRTQYAGLFAALGTTYGVGDGTTTFNLPDLRGRVTAGKSDMGGSDAGNLAGGGVLGAGLGGQYQTGAISGAASGSLTGGTGAPTSGGPVFASGGGGVASSFDHVHSNVTVGGSLDISGAASLNVVQPSRVMNKIICI
jgi:hypothetical protein